MLKKQLRSFHLHSERSRSSISLVLIGLLWVLLMGCTPSSVSTLPISNESSSEDTNLPSEVIAFPQQLPVEGERARLSSLTSGELALRDGCLRLVNSDDANDKGYLIIWPADHSVTAEANKLVIHDGAAQKVAEVGAFITIGGGELDEVAPITDTVFGLQEPTPPQCPGPYWIMGNVEQETSSSP